MASLPASYLIFDIFTINQHPNRFFANSAAIERTLQMMVVKPGRVLLVRCCAPGSVDAAP